MKNITSSDIVKSPYAQGTGRLKIIGNGEGASINVALCGDSTIDNGAWVDKKDQYINKTHTVSHQIALALSQKQNPKTYHLANFSIDGATTKSMLVFQYLNQVIPKDEDHPREKVEQLKEIHKWKPNVALLSVGGNNFRLAFQNALPAICLGFGFWKNPFSIDSMIATLRLLCRFTPLNFPEEDFLWILEELFPDEQIKKPENFKDLVDALDEDTQQACKKNQDTITDEDCYNLRCELLEHSSARKLLEAYFKMTQKNLYKEYKAIIDGLLAQDSTKCLVISSQYYPALTPFTPYFIYTGFAHLAHARGRGQSPFQVADEIINHFYREVLEYAVQKNIEIVFADVTSSMSPLGGYLCSQIEPNDRGSKLLGKLMAEAIDFEIPEEKKDCIPMISLDQQQKPVIKYLDKSNIKHDFKLKSVEDFIAQDRYRHIELLFAKDTPYYDRIVYFYEFLVGKQFDNEYTGLFAFGLLDLSLVTIVASYLWRVTLNEQMPTVLRFISGLISGPILVAKYLLVFALALAVILMAATLLCLTLILMKMKDFIYSAVSSVQKVINSFVSGQAATSLDEQFSPAP